MNKPTQNPNSLLLLYSLLCSRLFTQEVTEGDPVGFFFQVKCVVIVFGNEICDPRMKQFPSVHSVQMALKYNDSKFEEHKFEYECIQNSNFTRFRPTHSSH